MRLDQRRGQSPGDGAHQARCSRIGAAMITVGIDLQGGRNDRIGGTVTRRRRRGDPFMSPRTAAHGAVAGEISPQPTLVMQPSSSVILTPPVLARPPETERRSSSPTSPDDFDGFLLSGLE